MPQGLSQWQQDFLDRHQLQRSYLTHAQKWYSPLANSLSAHQNGASRPILVAVNGSQGSGKTTVCDYLREALEADYGLAVLSLSLDDFYLTREQRLDLARSVHPLLATRGVPGTHDMALLERSLDELLDPARAGSVAIPRFDKSTDDRYSAQQWVHVNQRIDLVLLEGWCMGARPQTAVQLAEPINALERDEDPDGRWRTYVNAALARDFERLYQRVDQWIMLRAPSFSCVYRWRLEQEQKLAATTVADGPDRRMDAAQVARFIQCYERLTNHCLEQLPENAQHVFSLDEQRQVTAYTQAGNPG
jgi:D-glycerate 3-kinase